MMHSTEEMGYSSDDDVSYQLIDNIIKGNAKDKVNDEIVSSSDAVNRAVGGGMTDDREVSEANFHEIIREQRSLIESKDAEIAELKIRNSELMSVIKTPSHNPRANSPLLSEDDDTMASREASDNHATNVEVVVRSDTRETKGMNDENRKMEEPETTDNRVANMDVVNTSDEGEVQEMDWLAMFFLDPFVRFIQWVVSFFNTPYDSHLVYQDMLMSHDLQREFTWQDEMIFIEYGPIYKNAEKARNAIKKNVPALHEKMSKINNCRDEKIKALGEEAAQFANELYAEHDTMYEAMFVGKSTAEQASATKVINLYKSLSADAKIDFAKQFPNTASNFEKR